MHFKAAIRMFMITVGIAATLVIVLSQAMPKTSEAFSQKVKTEQAADQPEAQTFLSSPSDVVPGNGSIQMADADRSLIETILEEEEVKEEFHVSLSNVTGYFNILFRNIISPNAP